jgi:Transposase DDE domain
MAAPDDLALTLEQWLAEHVARLDLDHRTGPGAPRVLPALLLWTGLVVCVIRGFGSQTALWRLLAQRGLWRYPRVPLTDDAVRARLARDGTRPLERLFAQITTLLAERIAPYVQTQLAPFAHDVLVLDETTLDRVARLLPLLRPLPVGDPQLLGGTLAALFDIRRQQWRRVAYRDNTTQDDKVAARSMVEGLAAGTLLLCDLGYFGFRWFDDLTDAHLFWLSRLRSKTSYEVIHVYYQHGETFDGLIWLGAYRADRAKHAVRLI